MLALVDDGSRPLALALLVLDEVGSSMTVMLLAELDQDREHEHVARPAERLVAELALKAPLRVDARDAEQEARFREAGITR